MAQHNIGHFYGMVQTNPKIVLDDETKQPVSAIAYIATATSSRRFANANEENNVSFNQIMIMSGVPEVAAKMAEMKMYDVVIIKGSLNTRNIQKTAMCEECHQRFIVNEIKGDSDEDAPEYTTSMVTFVTPIDIDIRDTELTEDEAMDILIEHREMSNEIQVIGNLCNDPVSWEGGKATSYQVGINRKFYLKDDDPATSSDYPFIRSYGIQAENDIEALHQGSLVLVDGFVKMRHFSRKSTCPFCNSVKTWTDKVLEIVPYSVEYLGDYKSGKERAEEKQAMLDME